MAIALKDIYIFKGVEKEFINLIIDNSRRIKVEESEYIIKEGEKSDGFAYIIQSGKAIVEKGGEKLSIIEEGNIFGEIALITNENRTASVKAITNMVLLKINK